jgi:homoserine dehydrogenase
MERVHPCLIAKNSYIAKIDGVLNAVVVDGLPIGRSVLQGEGAGPGPTSSALISDLCSVLKGEINYPFGISTKVRNKISKFNILHHICSSYLRIEVKDLPGVLSTITKIFAKNKISIKNLIQRPNKKNKKATIIIITHKNFEKNFNNLTLDLSKNKFVLKKPTLIRIEQV